MPELILIGGIPTYIYECTSDEDEE